jgi:hypothetical protein
MGSVFEKVTKNEAKKTALDNTAFYDIMVVILL